MPASDPRKRALELARKRAKQRRKMLEEQKRREAEKKNREAAKNDPRSQQQIYLEKVRKREEARKQQERDKLQNEMEKLKEKQKLVKETERRKKQKAEEERKQKEAELKKQKIQEELDRKKALEEKQKQEQLELVAKKQAERKKREQELLKNKTLIEKRNSVENTNKPVKSFDKSDSEIRESTSRDKLNISSIAITRHSNKPSLKLSTDSFSLVPSSSSFTQFTETENVHQISLISTTDSSNRLKNEQNILSTTKVSSISLESLNSFTTNGLSFVNLALSLWNNPITNEYVHSHQKKTLKQSYNSATKILLQKLYDPNFIWIPHASFGHLLTVILGMYAKFAIQSATQLKVVTDLSYPEIYHSLIDGIHLRLLIPEIHSSQDLSKNSKGVFNQSSKVSEIYHPITSLSLSKSIIDDQSISNLEQIILGNLFKHQVLKDFLFGLAHSHEKYPVKSLRFEKSLVNVNSDLNLRDIERKFQNFLTYCKELRLITLTGKQKYKNGSSRFIRPTRLIDQQIQSLSRGKSLSVTPITTQSAHPNYRVDFSCPDCGYPLNGSFQLCPHCSKVLTRKCRKCHQILRLSWTFCPYCASFTTSSSFSHPS